jgi:hypothetical protein
VGADGPLVFDPIAEGEGESDRYYGDLERQHALGQPHGLLYVGVVVGLLFAPVADLHQRRLANAEASPAAERTSGLPIVGTIAPTFRCHREFAGERAWTRTGSRAPAIR